jgi:hypothetical protein
MAVQSFAGTWPLLSFLYTVGRTPRTGNQPVARPLPIHIITQTQNKRTQISMPPVGFESTIPVFEREKIVHALDRAATLIGTIKRTHYKTVEIITVILCCHKAGNARSTNTVEVHLFYEPGYAIYWAGKFT